MVVVRESLNLKSISRICWTDSTIVLTWLRSHPSRWTTFVTNRVQQIHSNVPDAAWHHVPTASNPADCASRGLLGDDILNHDLWWSGPPWLRSDQTEWPSKPEQIIVESPLEEKIRAFQTSFHARWELADRFSSWARLVRVTAYLYKFVYACRGIGPDLGDSDARILSAKFCSLAKIYWYKQIQAELFSDAIQKIALVVRSRRRMPLHR